FHSVRAHHVREVGPLREEGGREPQLIQATALQRDECALRVAQFLCREAERACSRFHAHDPERPEDDDGGECGAEEGELDAESRRGDAPRRGGGAAGAGAPAHGRLAPAAGGGGSRMSKPTPALRPGPTQPGREGGRLPSSQPTIVYPPA